MSMPSLQITRSERQERCALRRSWQIYFALVRVCAVVRVVPRTMLTQHALVSAYIRSLGL